MKRLLLLVALVGFVSWTFAGEDPVLGIVTATGPAVAAGCVAVTSNAKLAFQCVPCVGCTSCRVRYRLLADGEFNIGYPIPTDGGPMTDGGSWGPLVDFTNTIDPYKVQSRVSQTRICFFAEDAGVGPDAGYGSLTSRVEVFGAYP